MINSGKETVIIVHGTWAAPISDKNPWYQPPDSTAASEGFVTKLDTALKERGSSARCWLHCRHGGQIFHWSGENSWIECARAAATLGEYVTKLQSEAWRCHIVAHSHGGNVVVEALPQITATNSQNQSLGKIVTLGTPFIDTMAPILKRMRHVQLIRRSASWMGLIGFVVLVAFAYFLLLHPLMFGGVVCSIYFQKYKVSLPP